jgi:N-acetylmuramoyl-L-alanine amidase
MIYVLSPGHGKDTKGKRSPEVPPGILEWEFNRDIVQRVMNLLDELDIESHNLVPEEYAVPLKERVCRVNAISKYEECCLICVHANAAGEVGWSNASGSRIFSPKKPKWGKKKIDRWEKSSELSNRINEGFEASSKLLDIPYSTRSPKEAGFYMLRKPVCPSVLVECGFMTSRLDAEFMASDNGRDIICNTIVGGIFMHNQTIKYKEGK